jgi:hypothetical protein
MAARFSELEARMERMMAQARSELDALILQDAPAAQFDAALQRFASFLSTPRARARTPAQRQPPGPRFVPNFRDIIALDERIPPVPATDRLVPDPLLGAYQLWLAFKRAEESGDASSLKPTDGKVNMNLPMHVRRHVAARMAKISSPPAASDPTAPVPVQVDANAVSPSAELSRAFEKLASKDDPWHLRQLADAWRALDQPLQVEAPSEHHDFNSAWLQIASTPEYSPLMALRERATREGVTAITGGSQNGRTMPPPPLAVLIRNGLNDTLGHGRVAEASRLIALDRAASALPMAEHDLFVATTVALSEAPAGGPTQAKADYLKVLHSPVDPATALRVATRFKEMLRTEMP